MPNETPPRRWRRESPLRSFFPWRSLVMLVVLGGVQYALAQQQTASSSTAASDPAATPPASQEPTGTAGESQKQDASSAAAAPAAKANETPNKPAAAKGSPQHFEPTEKVRPDFDVAFPIDI